MRSILLVLVLLTAGFIYAQEQPIDCSPQALLEAQQQLLEQINAASNQSTEEIQSGLYATGSGLMDLALACGYVPDEAEKSEQIKRTLTIASLPEIILSLAVGNDVDAILVELEGVYGDSFEGQLLYNGIEMGLDGTALGCAVCHAGEAAPLTEGTWTRIDEIRLADPLLAGYDIRRYLVESIVHPEAYIAEGFANVMPPNFGSRIDLQQLANLVAFLESQDQLLEDESP